MVQEVSTAELNHQVKNFLTFLSKTCQKLRNCQMLLANAGQSLLLSSIKTSTVVDCRPSRRDCPSSTRRVQAKTTSMTRSSCSFSCSERCLKHNYRCLCRSRLPGQASFQDGRVVAPPRLTSTPLCTVRPTWLVSSGRVWMRATQVEEQFGGRRNDELVQTRLGEATHTATQTSATMWEGDGARVGASLEVRVGKSSAQL